MMVPILVFVGGLIVIALAFGSLLWREHQEDKAFGRLSDAMFDAASRGVDVSFMNSCPDLHKFAVEREK